MNIENLIPPIYRKDHKKSVSNIFHGVYDSNSKVVSNRRSYPVYFGENQAILITITLKLMIQKNGEIAFVALLEPVPKDSKLILTNFKL